MIVSVCKQFYELMLSLLLLLQGNAMQYNTIL